MSDEALDLLNQMLQYDHAARVTPKDAMNHAYFVSVRNYNANQQIRNNMCGK